MRSWVLRDEWEYRGLIPWPQFLSQPQLQMHFIILTGTFKSVNPLDPKTAQKIGLYIHMAQSLTLRKERTHFSRPSLPPQTCKSPSVERTTQQARELLRGQQPQVKFPVQYSIRLPTCPSADAQQRDDHGRPSAG